MVELKYKLIDLKTIFKKRKTHETSILHNVLFFIIAAIMFCLIVIPTYGQNEPSKEILVYFSSGVERVSENQPARISSLKVKNALAHFKITEDKVTSAFPKFNEADTLRQTPDGRLIGLPNMARIFKIQVPDGIKRETVIDSIKKLPGVLFAEPNGTVEPHVVPNDQYFSYQWALQSGGGTGKIQAPEAWDIFTGSSSNIIGIVDGGIDGTHPDLSGKVSGDGGYGWDGHGIHVAGISSAKTNNWDGIKYVGVAGVDWNAQLHAQRVDNTDDAGTYQAVVDAVNYSSNVKVLNNSWGLTPAGRYSTTVRLAFAYAYKMNRTAVVSMGNNNGSQTQYPAGFGHGIIAIGSTDVNDVIAGSSNTGNHIDVSAPGVNIYSTYRNPDYAYNSGTSMAAPHVSGLASLLKGYNANLYNDDIEHIIQLSAEDKGPTGWDSQYGYGRINVKNAINLLRSPYILQQSTATGGTDVGSTDYYTTAIYGAPGLATGVYIVKRHEIRKTVSYSSKQNVNVWGRGVATNGWSLESPNFAMGWCDIVPGTVTSTSATLRTYIYQVWSVSGSYLGYYPTTASNVTFAYTIHGTPTPFSVSISGPSYLNPGQNGTWTANVSGGTPPYHYQWAYYYYCDIQPAVQEVGPLAPPCGYWWNVGSDSPQLTRQDYKDFRLRCIVTDAHNATTTGYKYVTVGGNLKKGNTLAANIPTEYSLEQNYPNPFNPSTQINYALPIAAKVNMRVYDLLGREVIELVNEQKEAGFYTINFNSSNLSSGIYLYRITAQDGERMLYTESKRMILMK